MTMRQVQGLLSVIGKSNLIDFYNQVLSYGTVHGAKLPTLNEFLSVSLNKEDKLEKVFDEKTDKILEERALKLLEERRSHHVK